MLFVFNAANAAVDQEAFPIRIPDFQLVPGYAQDPEARMKAYHGSFQFEHAFMVFDLDVRITDHPDARKVFRGRFWQRQNAKQFSSPSGAFGTAFGEASCRILPL